MFLQTASAILILINFIFNNLMIITFALLDTVLNNDIVKSCYQGFKRQRRIEYAARVFMLLKHVRIFKD